MRFTARLKSCPDTSTELPYTRNGMRLLYLKLHVLSSSPRTTERHGSGAVYAPRSPAAEVLARGDRRAVGRVGQSAAPDSFGADCGDERQRFDGGHAGLDSGLLRNAHRPVHIAA